MSTLAIGDYVKLTGSSSGVYVVEEVGITGIVEIRLLLTYYNDPVQNGKAIAYCDKLIRLNKYRAGDRVVEIKKLRTSISGKKKIYRVDSIRRIPPRNFLYILRRSDEGPKLRSEKELMIKRAKPVKPPTPEDMWMMQYPQDAEGFWDDM